MIDGIFKMSAWEIVLINVSPEENIYRLADRIQMTYSHVHKVIKELRDLGYVEITKVQRENIVSLTIEGERQKNRLVGIKLSLEAAMTRKKDWDDRE